MKRLSSRFIRAAQRWLILTLTLGLAVAVTLGASARVAHALPEYATRTGEACSACHISAGGGGPRTLRGLLWAARGRPDKVPTLPGLLIAPRISDGAELYDIACGGCHGYKGEGLFAIGLAHRNINAGSVRAFVVDGIPRLGMPAFDGQFTAEQLNALVAFVAGLSNGTIPPPPDAYPLPPARFVCVAADPACAARPTRVGGN
jgi:mono/diheme cytochrome c family protein